MKSSAFFRSFSHPHLLLNSIYRFDNSRKIILHLPLHQNKEPKVLPFSRYYAASNLVNSSIFILFDKSLLSHYVFSYSTYNLRATIHEIHTISKSYHQQISDTQNSIAHPYVSIIHLIIIKLKGNYTLSSDLLNKI